MDKDSSNIVKFPGESVGEIEAAAAVWLARLTSGSLTLAELAEFEFWRAASPERDRIYRTLEATWDRLGVAMAVKGVAGQKSSPWLVGNRLGPLHVLVEKWMARLGLAAYSGGGMMRLGQIATAMVALVVTIQYVSIWRYDYHTAHGELKRVVLADGSIVHMKGGSALNVSISDVGARTVELARGEAFFEVVHDASRPFTVIVGSAKVQDIGTGFSVLRSGQAGTVAVEHGVVAVAAGGNSEILSAGEKVAFSQYDVKRKQHVDTGVIAPWRRGVYVAENKPLGETLSDLDEYYRGRIVITSRALSARRVNAVVQLNNIDAWFRALNETDNVSVRHWGPLTIVGERQS